ncbi:MAG: T9SS type A sorting domain-containing protein [Crocinitomicaceae bacterium]|nr:T9SS type A sorting domain-containing protein [Crocinitomicaceae bacterium]
MKKTLLTLTLALFGFGVNSQVVFKVNTPASIASGYNLTYARINSDWGVADLDIPANSVLADIAIAGPDTLACTPLTPGSLTGKIAMVYRGSCEFGAKALAAQNAGAIAVIIVNNAIGEPIPIGGGVSGMSVTVPTIMISKETGALINERIHANETVNAFIGNKFGLFVNDLGMTSGDYLHAKSQAYPLALAGSAAEYSVKLAAKVRNYGTADQTNFVVNAKVQRGTTELYNENQTVTATLASGDSIMVTFPDFSEATYSLGQYKITYKITGQNVDESADDNERVTNFTFTDNIVSLGSVDANGFPNSTGGSKPATPDGEFKTCVFFQDANASRLGAQGMYFRASQNSPGDMTGEEIRIQAIEWNDVFVNVDDATIDENLFGEPAFASYSYDGDYGDSTIYQEFMVPFALVDDQKYLFCITTSNQDVFLGYDSNTKYQMNEDEYKSPYSPMKIGAAWSLGFVGLPIAAIGIKTFPIAELGVLETTTVQASVYPNPANDIVNIVVAGFVGNANLTVTDITGKIVMTEAISTNAAGKASVNTSELTPGLYIFKLQMNDGTVSNINVAIN